MLKGSLVALITPMDEAGGVDFDALRRLVDFHARSGTDGIVSVGTSGESATLDADEQIEVIRRRVGWRRLRSSKRGWRARAWRECGSISAAAGVSIGFIPAGLARLL